MPVTTILLLRWLAQPKACSRARSDTCSATSHQKLVAFERRTVINHLNRELVWLKHDKRPNVLNIRRSVAVSMITRAASKLKNWTPRMWEFRDWLIENLDDVYR
jgi:hypothetical protein